MPDQFTEVTKTGWGSRIMSSIKGIFVGLLLFIASFGVLYWNEGKVDMSDVAKKSVEIASESVDASADGKFVSVSGALTSEETLSDGLYLVAGDYLAIARNVEVYAWVEESESESDKDLGGSETTTTTYNYSKDWVSEAAQSSSFKVPEGHQNVSKSIDDFHGVVGTAKIGAYDVSMDKMSLGGFKELTLNEENTTVAAALPEAEVVTPVEGVVTTPPVQKPPVLSGNFVFVGAGSLSTPEIGDMRISYKVLPNKIEGTAFGELNGNMLASYYDEDTETSLYRFFNGTRNEAFATLHGEYKMMLWIFRVVGFLMMWIGLSALFGPISVFLDVVPVFGSLSRGLIGAIAFVVSLILSIVTILISMILHNVIALVVAVVVVILLGFYIMKKKGRKPTVIKA